MHSHRQGVRDWRDPSWTGIQSVQHGLPQHIRKQRLTLFGPNLVDIEGKSTLSLLIDEVRVDSVSDRNGNLICEQGHPSVLRVSSGKHDLVVFGRLLLLRVLHCTHFNAERCDNAH